MSTSPPIPVFKDYSPPTTDEEIAAHERRERHEIERALGDRSHPLHEGLWFMRRSEVLDEALAAEPRCRELGIPYLVPPDAGGVGRVGGYYSSFPDLCAVCGKPISEHRNPPPPPPAAPLDPDLQFSLDQHAAWKNHLERTRAKVAAKPARKRRRVTGKRGGSK